MGRPTHEASDNDKAASLRLSLPPPVRRSDSLPMKSDISTKRVHRGRRNRIKEDSSEHRMLWTMQENSTDNRTGIKPEVPTIQTDGEKTKQSSGPNESSSKATNGVASSTFRTFRAAREVYDGEYVDSDSEASEDSDFIPGAHFIGGGGGHINAGPSIVSARSEKSTETEHGLNLLKAIPVDNDNDEEGGVITEEMKVQIQEEARDKVLKGVVKAEEETEEDLKRQAEVNSRRRCIAISFFCLLLASAGAAVFLSAKNHKEDEGGIGSWSPTSAPTEVPPIFTSGEDKYNDICDNAFSLEETVGVPIFGTTVNSTKDEVDACEVVSRNGNGVWYRLIGRNRRMMASTCDKTFFDTQVSIFRGACGKLQCVAGNDQMPCGNGDQSQVAWFAESEIEYFVYVHGHRDSTGLFELAVDSMIDNGECDDAQYIPVDSAQLFGSTRGAANEQNVGLPQKCGSARQTAPGVWYSTTGTGGILSASLLTEGNTAFRGQVSVFVGSDCFDLQCVDGSVIGFASWQSAPDTEYFILVHGQAVLQGDFLLEITTIFDPTLPPPVDFSDPCPALEASAFVAAGSSVYASTSLEPIYNVEPCGNLVFSTAPGSWFKVSGTGGPLQVSTCNQETNFDTQISVFTGACGALECIDGNDQGGRIQGGGSCRDDSSAVTWFSLLGQEYFVLVHGFGDRAGDFVLDVDEITIESSEKCDTSIEIVPDGTSRLGSTQEANASTILPECTNSITDSPGAWYILEGTGNNVTASTCQESSAISSFIFVFQGDNCGNLECVPGVVTPCGNQASIAFFTRAGETYYVYVQTEESDESLRRLQSTGNETWVPKGLFTLSVEQTTDNDFCVQAPPPLLTDGSFTFGSTRSATAREGRSCIPQNFSSGRGLWYTVRGDGREFFASTCSLDFTNFASNIEIFSGSCESLNCVENSSLQCENRQGSISRWDSVEGVLYYVYVSGIGFNEYGNFALSIGSGNDSCYGAQLLPVDGSVTIGSTADATFDGSVPACGGFVTSPGVWYIYYPDSADTNLTASTCNVQTDFETEITVYQGSCGSLLCVDQTSTGLCGDKKTTVTWATNPDVEFYFIHVHGFGIGNFGLNVIEGNGKCESSLDLSLEPPTIEFGDFTEYFLSGSTDRMPEADALDCGIDYTSPAVWYTIVGSGTEMTVDACNELNAFNSQISIFTGNCDGDLECIATAEGFFTCEVGLNFETTFGMQYFILVHGALNFETGLAESGSFGIFLRQEEPVHCDRAVSVPFTIGDGASFISEDIIQSGIESELINDGQCGQSRDFGLAGHWYTFFGTGKNMTASTCFAGTDFDTQLTVYSGRTCAELVCVDGNDDAGSGLSEDYEYEYYDETFEAETDFPGFLDEIGPDQTLPEQNCGLTSIVSWPSEVGVTYFLQIHGFNDLLGSYVLLIE